MQTNSNKHYDKELDEIKTGITFKVGDFELLKATDETPVRQIFDNTIIDFLDTLSKKMLKNKKAVMFSDIATLAFWCRRASIIQMQQSYISSNSYLKVGRGIAFHIAPSNVAVNFAYSLITGLLSGNINIVRIPSKDFEQVNIICDSINEVLNEFIELKNYIILIRYGRDAKINDYLSKICNSRIIWGGDNTIRTIRQSPIPPRGKDISFADRYSLCIIHADSYLRCGDKEKIASDFYNDTYLNDQNACTSPKLIVWTGEKTEDAQVQFWKHLHLLLIDKYTIGAVQLVNKIDSVYYFAATCGDQVNPRLMTSHDDNNLTTRVRVNAITSDLMKINTNSGLFFEYETNNLCDILPICTEKVQTIGYFGIDATELAHFISTCIPRGIDRIVPIGKTLDFSLIWDGYDLITELSRMISTK